MYRRVLAFDFDGTLARDGAVPPHLKDDLTRLNQAGFALFLVTGRRYEGLTLPGLIDLFEAIVWENGAVVSRTATHEVYLPFGYIDPALIAELEYRHVPLENGLAIVSTWTQHLDKVWEAFQAWGGDATIVPNKGAIMILPAGAAKGTGLEQALRLSGYSPRSVISFGDGENDVSLLQVGELGVTVADGVPRLKAVADMVMDRRGPDGVAEFLETFLLDDAPRPMISRHERWIPLGRDADDTPVNLPGTVLAGGNIGIFGDSGAGKSWITGLLAEGMHLGGYQVLLIDPDGDFHGLSSLPRVAVFGGDAAPLPPPSTALTFLESTVCSVVLEMYRMPFDQRDVYITDLLRGLANLRRRKFRPHWVVLEEAQHYLYAATTRLTQTLLDMMPSGGWAIVTYRPDWLPEQVLTALDRCIVGCLARPETADVVKRLFDLPPRIELGEIAPEYALYGRQMVHVRSAPRRVPHIRHVFKYLDMPLPRHRRFYFATSAGPLGIEAASLSDFIQIMTEIPLESVTYHHLRGDFATWIATSLGDEVLSAQFDKLTRRTIHGEALRDAILKRAVARYEEISVMAR